MLSDARRCGAMAMLSPGNSKIYNRELALPHEQHHRINIRLVSVDTYVHTALQI